ncbi:zinc finger CCHC domain-containing protein 10-like [Camellia sinensis]|uniref:zinc finger CCHC domain-containing protein 10-like n=1 Tax=Camellia sinensis TaxID=4442 RepID=UPI001036D555|nr:zinc finger CCHC domain-containing protein 10-like [Camellia sinensis]
MPAPSDAPAGAATGPSVPPPSVERRARRAPTHSRGRVRGTRGKSGPSEHILGDDDDETSEEEDEAASPESESFEDGDDDAGSDSARGEAGETDEGSGLDSDLDSDNGADGDNAPEFAPPKKRTKRASRA